MSDSAIASGPGSSARRALLRIQRRHAVPVIVVPALGTAALVLLGPDVTWFRVGLLIAFYAASLLGITVGYHRLLTHGAFSCPPPVKAALAGLGCLAAEGPPIVWVANHRLHHQKSDAEGDPHSPHAPRAGRWARARAFAHAHVGWMLTEPPADVLRYAPDLLRDATVIAVNRRYLSIVVAGLAVPALLGGLVLGGPRGLLEGLLWGGLARIFLVQHVTWCINSVCHVWGGRPWQTREHSRNNPVLGVVAFGEGWHNNHHAAPTSAAHGLRWWQLDVSFGVIKLLSWLGLASDVVVASTGTLARKRAAAADGAAEGGAA
jgi:stearoyl-CoA desaturase (delta-9 desaturase)